MGPQAEVRVAAIQEALREVSIIDRLQVWKDVPVYSPKTFDPQNVAAVLTEVGIELSKSTTTDCSDTHKLSRTIDETTMRLLIQRHNPGLVATSR